MLCKRLYPQGRFFPSALSVCAHRFCGSSHSPIRRAASDFHQKCLRTASIVAIAVEWWTTLPFLKCSPSKPFKALVLRGSDPIVLVWNHLVFTEWLHSVVLRFFLCDVRDHVSTRCGMWTTPPSLNSPRGHFAISFWLHRATFFRDFRADSGLNRFTLTEVQRCTNPAPGAAIHVYPVDSKGHEENGIIESPSLRQH